MPPGLSHGLVSARSGPVPICWKRVSHRQKDPSGCPHCPSLLMGSWVILPPLRGNRHRILRQVRPQLAESGEVSCGSNCLILQKGKLSPEKLRDLPEDTQQWGDGQRTRSLFLSLNPSSRHRPQVHIPEGHLHHDQGQGYERLIDLPGPPAGFRTRPGSCSAPHGSPYTTPPLCPTPPSWDPGAGPP